MGSPSEQGPGLTVMAAAAGLSPAAAGGAGASGDGPAATGGADLWAASAPGSPWRRMSTRTT
jgi:hypothetical protein